MSRIILDISANTHKNDINYIKRMIDEIRDANTGKHEIIFKHQLFTKAGENIPLDHVIFELACDYAFQFGYRTTSSVFDIDSLKYLLQFDPCFVKIANNRSLDWLIGEVPRKIPVYVSIGSYEGYNKVNAGNFEISNIKRLTCISKYPAELKDYETAYKANGDMHVFGTQMMHNATSDHTCNFDLWHKYRPEIYEVHYRLEDSTGLDAGAFARTPAMLKEVL